MAKTAAQMTAENVRAAKALPVETKRTFWSAMMRDGKNLGEARVIAGIDDVMVAAQLVILLHTTVDIPMRFEDIK